MVRSERFTELGSARRSLFDSQRFKLKNRARTQVARLAGRGVVPKVTYSHLEKPLAHHRSRIYRPWLVRPRLGMVETRFLSDRGSQLEALAVPRMDSRETVGFGSRTNTADGRGGLRG
jgi:hypothetical protein